MNLLAMPFPILAEADLQEVVFVIVFLIVGFLQWLFSLMKKNKETQERAQQMPPSAEEQEARRLAWEGQTRTVEEVRPQHDHPVRTPAPPQMPRSAPPAAPSSPGSGSLGELMDTLRRSIDDVSSPRPAAPHRPAPVRPPALPAASRKAPPQPSAPAYVSSHMSRADAAKSALAAPEHPSLGTSVVARRAHPLTEMLKTTHGYQQAFILREVLGPCKALEDQP